MFGSEPIAQFLQADPAGYCERTDMIAQPVCLCAMKSASDRHVSLPSLFDCRRRKWTPSRTSFRGVARVQLGIVARGAGGKKPWTACHIAGLERGTQAEEIASGRCDGGTREKAGEVEDIKAIIQVFCVGLQPQRALFFLIELGTGGYSDRQR